MSVKAAFTEILLWLGFEPIAKAQDALLIGISNTS